MAELVEYLSFAALDYVAMVIYAGKASRYSESILGNSVTEKRRLLPAVALILMWMLFFSEIPVVIVFLFLYSFLLLHFLVRFGSSLAVALFASGTFLFHIANLYMLMFGIFALICDIETMDWLQGVYLYPVLIFLVILASMVCLEIFTRMIEQESIQILINNKRQLRFAATSLMFIDVYLMILSVAYDSGAYSSLTLLFLGITSVLLFGAFYTAFLHAVRMSILEVYETRFKDMESQLKQSNLSLGKLQHEAYTDVLTKVSSRRYGLLKLEKLLESESRFSICMIDLDRLKDINDTYGHQVGDKYLAGAASVLAEIFDLRNVCRLGGDEFLVIMPDKGEEEALEMMEMASKRLVEDFHPHPSVHPSMSYGVVEVTKVPFGSVSEVLEIADRRMYEMKQRHRTKK